LVVVDLWWQGIWDKCPVSFWRLYAVPGCRIPEVLGIQANNSILLIKAIFTNDSSYCKLSALFAIRIRFVESECNGNLAEILASFSEIAPSKYPNEVAKQHRKEAMRGQERTVLGTPGRNCLEKIGGRLVNKMKQIALSPNKDKVSRGVESPETFSANC
jgi:hypothetical protein